MLKVFTSGSSGNKDVKANQQRALLILDSKKVEYEIIDITQPENKDQRNSMLKSAKTVGENKAPLCPQFFLDSEYLGDFEDFENATEIERLEVFLHLKSEADFIAEKQDEEKEVKTEEKKEEEEEEEEEKEDDQGSREGSEEEDEDEGSKTKKDETTRKKDDEDAEDEEEDD